MFTEPQAYAPSISRRIPSDEGFHTVLVRFLDEAGNYSPPHSVTILLDQTSPQWLRYEDGTALVRDPLSGVVPATAEYALSFDGGSWWLPWSSAVVSATNGITGTGGDACALPYSGSCRQLGGEPCLRS